MHFDILKSIFKIYKHIYEFAIYENVRTKKNPD